MRKILALAALIFGATLCLAQTAPPASLTYTWPQPTTTGQLGNYLVFNGTQNVRPGNYTIDWSISGTAPSACTFRVEGSNDNVNWFGLDTSTSNSCTTSNMESIAYKPVLYLRINILTWTAGSGTIAFHYAGGQS